MKQLPNSSESRRRPHGHSRPSAIPRLPAARPPLSRGQALAASSGPEAIAAGVKLGLKACPRAGHRPDLGDRFDRHLERRLHNAVPGFRSGQALDRRYPQRTGSPAAFGDVDPFDRRRPIPAGLQCLVKLAQIPFCCRREPLDALAIHPRRPFVPRHLPPRGFQGRGPDDLVRQTEPLASCEAVGQRRHHAVRPNRRFRPANLAVAGFCPLRSLRRHSRDGCLRHLWCFRIQLPTSLPSRRFCCPPLSRRVPQRYYEGSDSPRSHPNDGSLRLLRLAFPSFRPQPRKPSDGRFSTVVSAPAVVPGFALTQPARHGFAPNRVRAPSDRQFASGCSPPRRTATQLPSATKLRHALAGTPTPQTRRPRGRPGYTEQVRARRLNIVLLRVLDQLSVRGHFPRTALRSPGEGRGEGRFFECGQECLENTVQILNDIAVLDADHAS